MNLFTWPFIILIFVISSYFYLNFPLLFTNLFNLCDNGFFCSSLLIYINHHANKWFKRIYFIFKKLYWKICIKIAFTLWFNIINLDSFKELYRFNNFKLKFSSIFFNNSSMHSSSTNFTFLIINFISVYFFFIIRTTWTA